MAMISSNFFFLSFHETFGEKTLLSNVIFLCSSNKFCFVTI